MPRPKNPPTQPAQPKLKLPTIKPDAAPKTPPPPPPAKAEGGEPVLNADINLDEFTGVPEEPHTVRDPGPQPETEEDTGPVGDEPPLEGGEPEASSDEPPPEETPAPKPRRGKKDPEKWARMARGIVRLIERGNVTLVRSLFRRRIPKLELEEWIKETQQLDDAERDLLVDALADWMEEHQAEWSSGDMLQFAVAAIVGSRAGSTYMLHRDLRKMEEELERRRQQDVRASQKASEPEPVKPEAKDVKEARPEAA